MKTVLALCLLLSLAPACASKLPPNLTPDATKAWYATEVIHDLDRVRDVANDAHKTTPPLITAAEALRVVQWHEVAITITHNARTGWQSVLDTSIQELQTVIAPGTWKLLSPYIELVRNILKAVQS